MALNISRYKADLEKLVEESGTLELALLVKVHGAEELSKLIKKDADEEERKKTVTNLKNLAPFRVSYESWYSECLALIRQILPDRLADFREHFDVPKNRKDITYASYRIQDALKVT